MKNLVLNMNWVTRAEDYLMKIDTSMPLRLQKSHLCHEFSPEEEDDGELCWWRDFLF
jgi:hypothetical protein